MNKKKIIAFLSVFILSINIFVLPAFAYRYDADEWSGYIETLPPTYSDALNFFTDYMASRHTAFENMMPSEAHYILLCQDITATNNVNYLLILINTTETSVTRSGQSIKCASYVSEYQLNFNAYRRGSEYELTRNSMSHQDSGSFYVDESYTVLESDLTILNGDGEVVRPPDHDDYDASISYDSESNSLLYRLTNMSTDTTFGVRYGIYDYADFGLITVEPGLYWGDSKDLQVIIDWANDHNLDYLNMVAYMTIYNGIDVVETITCPISEALDNAEEEDGMFDEEKEYEDFPDPSDYFSNPPDFPTLSPTPDFPGFDPEHPIDSIANIIHWLASVIVTWIQNIIEILKWIIATIVYYLVNGYRFLKDCFLTLVHNIGIALYNLVVKLRALITYLALPKKEILKERFNKVFPIFGQFRALFTSWGGGNQTITITLFDKTASINALDSLGSSACSIFYNISTLMIGATTAFSLFNIITSIFGISLSGRGGDD